MPLIDQVLDALEAHNAVYIHSDRCASCLGDNKVVGKFLLLAVEWSVKGKLYPAIGLFVCPSCSILEEIDQRQLLKNLVYMVSEFNLKVLE